MRRSIIIFLMMALTFGVNAQQTFPVNGTHDDNHLAYAFINAKIYVDYKTLVDSATLLIMDGKIEEVGKSVKVPAGAVVYDLKGKSVYPSLIDVFSDYGMPEPKRDVHNGWPQMATNKKGAYDWNQAIKPETNAKDLFVADEKKAEQLRKYGFGCVQTISRDGIARGSSALVTLADGRENNLFVKDVVAAHYSFDKGVSIQDYPSSLMGAIALIRQTYLDAQWYAKTSGAKEYNISLDAWNRLQSLPQIFEVGDKYSVLRADRIAKEFGANYIIKGRGDEYQRVNEIKATNDAMIIPLSFPMAYDVDDAYDALQVNLGDMKHWELAPTNPSVLEKAGIVFALTAIDNRDKGDFFRNLRKAIEYGLSDTAALKALTQTPAQMLKVTDKVGSLKKGMIANFLITSKSLFDKENIIYDNYVNGKRYQINDFELKDIRGNYSLIIGNQPSVKLTVSGEMANPVFSLKEDSSTIKINFNRMGNQVSLQFELKKTAAKGSIRLNGYLDDNKPDVWKGTGQIATGEWVSWSATRTENYKPEPKKDSAKVKSEMGFVTYPNEAYGWKDAPKQETVLIKNATVWTNEKEGILQNTDVLIQGGKITKVGKDLEASGAKVIDAAGKHLSPGIVDEHSHIAIYGDVNEGTQSVTSEVRIGDVVYPDDINIYRQLSGGVTTSHLLHGSANAIGGQTQLVKLRWGAAPEKMKFEGADGFIKFALGENVKQSNWGDRSTIRFPQTRMGVEQVYMDAFTRAKEYEASWNKFNLSKSVASTTPRKDLELDALV
ncbi:MAG: amidohydrolase, partial [Bacteroidota bacterium]